MGLARETSMDVDVEEMCMEDVDGVDRAGALADGCGEYRALHEQLVRYVRAAGGGGRRPCGVWREHSYARAGRAPRRPPRVLLAPPETGAHVPGEPIDVVGDGGSPRLTLPGGDDSIHPDSCASEECEADDWEARLALSAPSAAHARLAACAAETLTELRLMRLAAARAHPALRREQARKAAAKLRRVLAPAWSWGGAAWAVSGLLEGAGGALRPLLLELLGELRRVAPRLVARLPAVPRAPSPECAPLGPFGRAADVGGPLLLWLSSGRRADARWAGRLGALLPLQVLRAPRTASPAPPPVPPAPAPPDQWCAARAAAARAALTDALNNAGPRPVFVAGCGAGAVLAAALAGGEGVGTGVGGAAVRGVALLGPALAPPDGAAGVLDARVPLLVVAGERAPGGRAAALQACGGGARSEGGARRLLLVAGADGALRLPARRRLALRVPQAALDAAIAEEVMRWVAELADTDSEETDTAHETSGELEDEEEYSHLPPPAPSPCHCPSPAPSPAPSPCIAAAPLAASTPSHTPPPAPAHSHALTPTVSVMSISAAPAPAPAGGPGAAGGGRAIEIVEGRVVTRVSGSTPLLLAPRRVPPAPPAHPASPAASAPAPDIMQLPIVFADDPPAQAPSPAPVSVSVVEMACAAGPSPVTVTSGAGRRGVGVAISKGVDKGEQAPLKYTRVIVAKRGPPASASVPPPAPGPPAPHPAPAAAARARPPRPLLLRRALRVLGRPPVPLPPPHPHPRR